MQRQQYLIMIKKIIFVVGFYLLSKTLAMASNNFETFKCDSWTNAGLRMKGNVTLQLTSNNLEWTNGKLTGKADLIHPKKIDEKAFNKPMRIYLAEDKTAVYFLKQVTDRLALVRAQATVMDVKENRIECTSK